MRATNKFLSLICALCVPLLVANCLSDGTNQSAADKPAYSAADQPAYSNGATVAATPKDPEGAAAALASAGDVDTGDYRISPRDILDVSVFQVPDLNKTVQVGADGNITLPLIGRTGVRGKTTQQAEQIIASKLSRKYLQSPQVTVSIKQFGQKVTINGSVKTPRVLSADGSLTLSQAIAEAGGLSETANSNRVHIARVVNQHVQDETYDLDAIQSGKSPDPALHAGDIVVAEESGAKVAFKNIKDLLPFAVLATLI